MLWSLLAAKLEECLLDCDPDCTLYNILRFLLLALFVTMDDEEEKELSLSSSELSANKMNHGESVKVSEEPGGVASEQVTDLLPPGTEDAPEEGKEVPNPKEEDDLDEQLPINEGAFSSASIYATWAQRHQGVSLHNIQLDYFTITEILRLHLLSSGQTKSTSACRLFRYQSRGGYASSDDPGIEFCRRNKALLQKMSRVPVYDLPPEEKLLLISVLCHQLLTYSVIRDALDESAASLKAARRNYKNLCSELERLNKPGRRKREKREVLTSKDKYVCPVQVCDVCPCTGSSFVGCVLILLCCIHTPVLCMFSAWKLEKEAMPMIPMWVKIRKGRRSCPRAKCRVEQMARMYTSIISAHILNICIWHGH